MRKTYSLQLAAVGAFALMTTLSAAAQEPPKLEKLDEGEPPAITIRQPSTAQEITETRGPGGEIKEIKVKSGGSTYYLRPRQATGSPPSDSISVPQWVIHEFGAGQPQQEPVEPQRLQPAPAQPSSK